MGSTSPDSPIGKFLAEKGEGIHHVAFAVSDLEQQLEDAQNKQVGLIDKVLRKGAEGIHIAFLHPKSTHRVSTELCENKGI